VQRKLLRPRLKQRLSNRKLKLQKLLLRQSKRNKSPRSLLFNRSNKLSQKLRRPIFPKQLNPTIRN
jgi:hypothetical protein